MKTLNLHRLWGICDKLSNKQSELWEQDIYVYLLGHRSKYVERSFESFLNYYSFSIDGDKIVVFNNDGIPYESYTNNDFSTIPSFLLKLSEKGFKKWFDGEIEIQLKKQEEDKSAEKDRIREQINRLQKQLENG
jgi:hypothetical protein